MCVFACVHVLVCVCYCLCARLAQHQAQGEGLILCGLERINFVLTLAGCGLHPYPPLLCLPGASQRRQASEDGEEGGRDSKKCHFRKGLYSLAISPFYELRLDAIALQIYVLCQSLSVHECVCLSRANCISPFP